MNTPRHLLRTGLAAGFAFACAWAIAQGAPGGPPGGARPPAPPPEAIAACRDKAVGATATFTGRRGEPVSGTCQRIGDVIALRPAGGPPGRPPAGPASAPK